MIELKGRDSFLRYDGETLTIRTPLGKVIKCQGARAHLAIGYALGVSGDDPLRVDAFCQGLAFALQSEDEAENWRVVSSVND